MIFFRYNRVPGHLRKCRVNEMILEILEWKKVTIRTMGNRRRRSTSFILDLISREFQLHAPFLHPNPGHFISLGQQTPGDNNPELGNWDSFTERR